MCNYHCYTCIDNNDIDIVEVCGPTFYTRLAEDP